MKTLWLGVKVATVALAVWGAYVLHEYVAMDSTPTYQPYHAPTRFAA